MGILTSPFMAAAPHCVAIRWVIYEGGNMITTMWVSAGTYIAAKVCRSLAQNAPLLQTEACCGTTRIKTTWGSSVTRAHGAP